MVDGVYAIEGPHEQRSPENLGNNATFGFVVTDEGVVLVDPGGSYKGAAVIAAAIKTVTDQPVTYVINTGGQDHRWLGNGYFQERGATIIASNAAVADHKARVNDHFFALSQLIGTDALTGTKDVYASQTFERELDLTIGGLAFQLRHVAAAHTPGDSFVWLPEKGVVFTGDIVYVQRMLGVGPQSSIATWLDAFAAIKALAPLHVVPGHGPATDIARAQAETGDYLVMLRKKIGAIIENGGDINDATAIDQSAFAYLETYEQIKGRNAQQVFQQMEWE
ncbi:MAG TPA: MBL fold metallo-hydrolase [Magnetovibrio sp.]